MAAHKHFDAVVIGSGIGGLTAAALMARYQRKRVLVLEQHFEIGGQTHAFRRKGYSWDVGLHYVGEMTPGSLTRNVMDAVTDGEVRWRKMPSRFDRVAFADLELAVPDDPISYQNELFRLFPHEKAAIVRYFADVARTRSWLQRRMMGAFFPAPISEAMRFSARWLPADAVNTTQRYLDQHVRDSRLQMLLTYAWGNYGLPPQSSAFAAHALITSHYLQGAYYPEGGAERIGRAAERVIEQAGGAVLINSDVQKILLEGGRAVGVRARHAPAGEEIDYRANIIISAVGANLTYSRLLPGGKIPIVDAAVNRLPRLDNGCSAVILYLGLEREPTDLGIAGENHWIFVDANPNDLHGATVDLLAGQPRAVYVSFPSLKAADGRPATAELIALVDPAAFQHWHNTHWRQRGVDYEALKDCIADGLLRFVETRLPGLRRLVCYAELATPLSIEHFTARAGGRMYGIALTPERLREPWLQPATPVRGLYLAGSDAATLGIVGAMMGGVAAVCRSSGLRETGRLMRLLRQGKRLIPPELDNSAPMAALPNARIHGIVIANDMVTESVHRLVLELPRALYFLPGQYLRLEVAPLEWRDYSIAAAEDRYIHLLINTRFGGVGSAWAQQARPGQSVRLRGPAGSFILISNDRPKLFIATGTGVTPILAMLAALATHHFGGHVQLLFGCRRRSEDFTGPYLQAPRDRIAFQVTTCLSQENADGPDYRSGRVTDALPTLPMDWNSCDVYASGNPDMIKDVVKYLALLGVETVHTEYY
jgi:phytoene dehydrogenase-like protein/NAD(P)H-flavin reductase